MTEKEIRVIQARIKEELDSINRLLLELKKKELLAAEDKHAKTLILDDSFLLRAIGSVLHDFYVIAENIFEIIARDIDEALPQGTDWHIRLLKQMSLEVPKIRIAVISKETMAELDKYRAFRQVFRNVYGFNLNRDRVKELLERLPDVKIRFNKEIQIFIKKMEEIMKK